MFGVDVFLQNRQDFILTVCNCQEHAALDLRGFALVRDVLKPGASPLEEAGVDDAFDAREMVTSLREPDGLESGSCVYARPHFHPFF